VIDIKPLQALAVIASASAAAAGLPDKLSGSPPGPSISPPNVSAPVTPAQTDADRHSLTPARKLGKEVKERPDLKKSPRPTGNEGAGQSKKGKTDKNCDDKN